MFHGGGELGPLSFYMHDKTAVPCAACFPSLCPVQYKFRNSIFDKITVDTSLFGENMDSIFRRHPIGIHGCLLTEFSGLGLIVAPQPKYVLDKLGAPAKLWLIAFSPIGNKLGQLIADKLIGDIVLI
jgi:hypothetical protein